MPLDILMEKIARRILTLAGLAFIAVGCIATWKNHKCESHNENHGD